MFSFFKREKAECVVINDSSNYCYVDGVPYEVMAYHNFDFDKNFFWDRHKREFSFGVQCNGSGYHIGRPKICVSTEKRARQIFDFLDKLFYAVLNLPQNIRKGGFKHLLICVKNPVVALYVNELLNSTDDLMTTQMFGWYQKYRERVHVIPYSVCGAIDRL